MKKKPFPKRIKEINVKEDLGYDVTFTVWDDPSRYVILALINSLTASSDDDDEKNTDIVNNYFQALSELIIDCSIEGACFDTAEDVVKTYELPSVPWGFWHNFVVLYLARAIDETQKLGKVLRRLNAKSSSGAASNDEGEK